MDNLKSLLFHKVSTSSIGNDAPILGKTVIFGERFTSFVSSQIWEKCSLWNFLIVLLILTNLKCIPFIWHFRILNGISRTIKTQRPKVPPNYKQLFQPLVTTSRVPLMEIDFMMHKTNSSYFADIDVARAHFLSTLFSNGIEHFRGGTGAFAPFDRPMFSCALGSVTCSFKHELKAYESYELWTRILSWDEKWVYIVTHFVRAGTVKPKEYSLYPEQNPNLKELNESEGEKLAEQKISSDALSSHPGVVATALSKCVFKNGRRTVSPVFMLKKSGILPPTCEDKPIPSSCTPENSLWNESCKSSDSGIAVGNDEEECNMDRIEKERTRGMESARLLSTDALTALELEFTGDNSPILGRHIDGIGFEGLARCAVLLGLNIFRDLFKRLKP
ncbi:putative thioesterase [Erysiphe necator]|nr:putative thioesterase [Erysiphe necator]